MNFMTAEASYDDVELMLFSDHGMTDVAAEVDLMAVIDATGLRFGRDYVAMYDSTMARFWLLSPAAERLREVLGAQSGGRVLGREE